MRPISGINTVAHDIAFQSPLSLHRAVEAWARINRAHRTFAEQDGTKTKKPGNAGLFDEYPFRSVHFASLAI
jgi:hypothetical protein